MKQVLLASRSPRRREILEDMGVPYVLVEPGEEELSPGSRQAPRQVVVQAARSKALGAKLGGQRGLLLAVDTVVALGDRSFGKPRDRAEAGQFLQLLEGGCHEVWTAMCMSIVDASAGARGVFSELQCCARVAMRRLSMAERDEYLASNDWCDKAGGYGIQGLASSFVSLESGEIGSVIGLPRGAFEPYWEAYLAGEALPHV